MDSAPLAPTRSRSQTQGNIWTHAEDDQLAALMSAAPTASWNSLLPFFPGKSAQQIAGRWGKVLNPNLVKGSWTREEDEAIIEFVSENGPRNWVKLAELLPGRIGKQCRERWTNHLSPSVARSTWSNDEDCRLVDLHRQYGNQWTIIASFMEGRTDNDVKNRWNSSLKRRIERIERGEPEFKKRGRKPKIVRTSSSECESPEFDKTTATTTQICIFPKKAPVGIPKSVRESPGPLEENRISLELLVRKQIG
jgi:hypothetical protein